MLYDKKWDAPIVQPLLPEQQILLDAADLLEKDGWCQGQIEDADGRHCAVGAIAARIRLRKRVPIAASRLDDRSGAGYLARVRLRKLVPIAAALTLTEWNDAPGRTKEEVVAAMREAAKS